MRIWSSDHVFEHPWHTVVNAAYRKYPNPMNAAITATDIVEQKLDAGVLKTEKILQSHFHVPQWATKLTGFSGTQYSHEYTEIDPARRSMVLVTRNLNCIRFLRVDERLKYIPHPEDSRKTLLMQEASVSVNLPVLTDYCEKTFLSVYSNNALTGRKGVEWVIDHLKREYNELSTRVSTEVRELSSKLFTTTTNLHGTTNP